jgi:hypothetical protein
MLAETFLRVNVKHACRDLEFQEREKRWGYGSKDTVFLPVCATWRPKFQNSQLNFGEVERQFQGFISPPGWD